MRLNNTKLKQDPLRILGRLPNLTLLELANDAYIGKEMECIDRRFPQLEIFRLSWLRTLEKLIVDDQSMPRLKIFSREDCSNLMEVPMRLRILPNC